MENGRVPGKSFLTISAMNELYFCKSPEQKIISVRLFILHLTMDRNNYCKSPTTQVLVGILVNVRNRTGEERRQQALCDKRGSNFV